MAPVNKLTPGSTLSMDTKVLSDALKLQDSALLTKLSAAARDMPALEARHHKACLTSLYNRVRAAERQESKESSEPESMIHSLVFAELLDYIEETQNSSNSASFSALKSHSFIQQKAWAVGNQWLQSSCNKIQREDSSTYSRSESTQKRQRNIFWHLRMILERQ